MACLKLAKADAAFSAHPLVNRARHGAIAKATDLFHRNAKVLDGQLKGRQFVTGETLTVADFSLGAGMNLAEPAHLPIEPYGEIKRWYKTLSALPAWQKTLAQATPIATAA